MKIQSTIQTATASKVKTREGASAEADSAEKKDAGITVRDVVTKSAFAAGGAMGGVGLGVATGHVVSRLTGNSFFSEIGGAAGALGGAAVAVAAASSDDVPSALKKGGLAWSLSVGGSLGGQFGLELAGRGLVAVGASPWLGEMAPLVGTFAGGVTGASMVFKRSEGQLADMIVKTARVSQGAVIGAGVGGIAQAIMGIAPALSNTGQVAPFLGAATGAALGLATATTEPESGMSATLDIANQLTGSTIGYGVGSAVGGLATLVGGNAAYAYALPAAGAAFGALMCKNEKHSEGNYTVRERLAIATAATSVGTMIGDLAGNGLTALTGHQIYRQAGALVGGANGLMAQPGFSPRIVATSYGATLGVAGGTLLGAAMTALTGQQVWQTALPLMGTAAGGLGGLATVLNYEKEEADKAAKEAEEKAAKESKKQAAEEQPAKEPKASVTPDNVGKPAKVKSKPARFEKTTNEIILCG